MLYCSSSYLHWIHELESNCQNTSWKYPPPLLPPLIAILDPGQSPVEFNHALLDGWRFVFSIFKCSCSYDFSKNGQILHSWSWWRQVVSVRMVRYYTAGLGEDRLLQQEWSDITQLVMVKTCCFSKNGLTLNSWSWWRQVVSVRMVWHWTAGHGEDRLIQ